MCSKSHNLVEIDKDQLEKRYRKEQILKDVRRKYSGEIKCP